MSRPHMRPRIEIVVPASLDAVRTEFQERVEHPACACRGRFGKQHLHVEVGQAERHFWSPTLDVRIEETEGGTLLRGRFAPHPNVWTLYVFGYSASAFAALLSGTWGMVQGMLGWTPVALWGVAGAGGFALFLWLSARVGARLGHDQMEQLYRMIDGLGTPRRDDARVAPGDTEATTSPATAQA